MAALTETSRLTDSQSSNPGSIPDSAAKLSLLRFQVEEVTLS
jgi:hypothetical protein